MALLNQKAFERKLQNMSSAQDSVQTVSLWMIHHKKHADDMAFVWLDQLKKASKADRRLVLFYLANDVLQNSRKKGKEFSHAFTKILREAMQLLSEKAIKGNVERVIKIWEERKLFEKDYLEALRTKLASGDVPVISKKPKETKETKEAKETKETKETKEKVIEKEKEKEVKAPKQKRLPPADFKPSKLIDALKALRDFEGEVTLKESQLNSLRIDASDLESVHQLKDRTGGGKFCEEYELATSKLEDFSGTLLREQQERKNIIKVLEDGEAFYDVSYGEVKVIVHAYKTFGNRLTSLKKKVDSKVNRLAQKEAEKAKTGPVSAPQASFLTSGLPDVAEGSAPSTPTQAQQNNNKSPEEDKPIDPTVDNIEVADMDIEDDSDSEKSDTSEEASVEDPKSSNDQTPNSTESSDSQPGQSTTQELEITPVISPVASVAPARPLTSNLGTMMPLRGSMLPNQPRIGPPRPPVGVIIRPFMGVQGVRFPAHTPQFRPGVRPIQPHPGMAQNQLLRPSGIVPGPGQIPRQGQPFSQMQRPTGLLPNANAHLPGSMGMMQPFPLGSGFVHSQAPLPLAATTVSAPVQVITNSVPRRETSQDNGRGRDVGSPDSETSAPSPVGSPELNLVEGDETPETTPAPLGDVDVNDNTGFQTNKSFFENPVKSPTTSLGLGFSGAPSVAKTFVPTVVSESPSSSNSTPSTSDQLGGQDAALAKKDNGQKVSAVDILAQLLSRGRKMQQPNDTDAHSASITPPVAAPIAVAVPVATQENSDEPQSKPLLSLIDSLFPKLSDSIKTLKEKEKAGNSPNPPVVNIPTSLPARPLPSEGQFQHPSNIGREQPQFQQTGLRSILKRGQKTDQELQEPFQAAQEFGMNHADVPGVQHQGPERADPSSNFPEEGPMGRLVEMQQEPRDDAGPGPRHDHDVRQMEPQGNRMNINNEAPTVSPFPGTHFQGPPVRGGSPRFPQERPFDRPLDMSPRGLPPFGHRLPFHEAHGPQFNQSRDNTGPPIEIRECLPGMPGWVPPEQPPHGHSSRGPFRDGLPRRPLDTSTVHQEHHPDMPMEDKLMVKPPNDGVFVNGPPGVTRIPSEGAPVHRPDPRQSPHEQVPRGDGPPPHRASYPGMMDEQVPRGDGPPPHRASYPGMMDEQVPRGDGPPPHRASYPGMMDEQVPRGDGPPPHRASYPGMMDEQVPRGDGPPPHCASYPGMMDEQVPRGDGPPPHRASYPGMMDDIERRREFERREEYRRDPHIDHGRGPWDFPYDHPGPPPPDWRGPPVSPRGDLKRADFREDDPSMWTSFDSPGRSPRTYEGYREGPPEFDRFHGYGPPGRRRPSVGDFESERIRYPLKRPGPPPVPFPGPSKRPYY